METREFIVGVRFLDVDMPAPELHAFPGGHVGVFSSRCPDVEGANEDAAAIIPVNDGGGVLVLADGMSGAAAGQQASRLAMAEMEKAVEATDEGEQLLRTAIINGFENANQAVKDLGIGAATTMAAVEIQGNEIRPYHVGDTVIMITGGRGKVKHVSIAHSPIGYAIEAGLLDELEAMYHEDRHIVSNVIGSQEMHIQIGPTMSLAPRDTLLLASDGLFDNLHLTEIIDVLYKGPLLKSLKHLADFSKDRMVNAAEGQPSKPDDMTILTFRQDH